jgi:hypothetical protein
MDATKIDEAKKLLSAQGCKVGLVMNAGMEGFQIDYCKHFTPRFLGSEITISSGPCVLATPEEMEHLFDGVYSPDELLDLLVK